MTSKLQRFIDLEIEAFLHDGILSAEKHQEHFTLKSEIEAKLGEEYASHN